MFQLPRQQAGILWWPDIPHFYSLPIADVWKVLHSELQVPRGMVHSSNPLMYINYVAGCKVARVDLLTDKDPGQSAEQKLGNITEMNNNTTYWNFATW